MQKGTKKGIRVLKSKKTLLLLILNLFTRP